MRICILHFTPKTLVSISTNTLQKDYPLSGIYSLLKKLVHSMTCDVIKFFIK